MFLVSDEMFKVMGKTGRYLFANKTRLYKCFLCVINQTFTKVYKND